MACGVLSQDGKWQPPARKPDFLFPVHALSKVFRGKFLAALAQGHKGEQLGRDPQGEDAAWRERRRQLYQHDWVVYAKTPLGGPAQVLEYLSRYTHRTAIGNQRIRHYGVLASACKGQKLEAARLALAIPASNPVAIESAGEFLQRVARMDAQQCPCCERGRLRTVTVLPSPTRLPAPGAADPARPAALCRGPP